ncbi:MAG: hypothetical protein ACLUDU_03690 [Butyricimonas faecihominis]
MLVEKGNDNLHVTFGGTVPLNPTQLIASPRMGELLACLKASSRIILTRHRWESWLTDSR